MSGMTVKEFMDNYKDDNKKREFFVDKFYNKSNLALLKMYNHERIEFDENIFDGKGEVFVGKFCYNRNHNRTHVHIEIYDENWSDNKVFKCKMQYLNIPENDKNEDTKEKICLFKIESIVPNLLKRNNAKFDGFIDLSINIIEPIKAKDNEETRANKLVEIIKKCREEHIKKSFHDYIISGPPGSGKSHFVDEYISEYLTLPINGKNKYIERFLMTGASMHEDLWGAYKPVRDDSNKIIKFKFVPGPFARILKKALHDPDNNYVMIIEELNRGNANDVLGELLQLFDRKKDKKESQYRISMQEYVREFFKEEENKEVDDNVKEGPNKEVDDNVKEGSNKEVDHINLKEGLYLPDNLFVICTMNNSDAGVQAIDATIRRRFAMMYVDVDGNIYGGDFLIRKKTYYSGKTAEICSADKIEECNKKIIHRKNKIGKHFLDKIADKEGNISKMHYDLAIESYLFSIGEKEDGESMQKCLEKYKDNQEQETKK